MNDKSISYKERGGINKDNNMKQLLIILTLILSTNVFAQTLEERAAVRACDCIQKIKTLNDENYRKCLATSITDVMMNDKNSNDRQWMLFSAILIA